MNKELEEKIQYLGKEIKAWENERSRSYEIYLDNDIKYQNKIEWLTDQLSKLKNKEN